MCRRMPMCRIIRLDKFVIENMPFIERARYKD